MRFLVWVSLISLSESQFFTVTISVNLDLQSSDLDYLDAD
jgi:hypothetical protein